MGRIDSPYNVIANPKGEAIQKDSEYTGLLRSARNDGNLRGEKSLSIVNSPLSIKKKPNQEVKHCQIRK